MKKLIVTLILSAVMLSAMGLMSPVCAADLPKGTLTVIPEYNGTAVSGINVKCYLIATAAAVSDSTITYNPASINGIVLSPNMSAEDNVKLAGFLSANPSVIGKLTGNAATGGTGGVIFNNLSAGLYLVVQDVTSGGNNNLYSMQASIVPVPCPDPDVKNLNYIVTAYPKLEDAKGTVTVTKKFSNPATDTPADNVTQFMVVLSQNNVVKYVFLLSGANGWTAVRTDIAIGTYNVDEINIPTGYKFVSSSDKQINVIHNGNKVVSVTNTKIAGTTTETTTASPTTTAPVTPTVKPTTTAAPTIPTTTADDIPKREVPTTAPATIGEDVNIEITKETTHATTADSIFQPETAPVDSSYTLASIPTYAAVQTLIQLPNGWFAEDLGGGLYAIFDADGVPLGYVQLGDGDDIMTYDVEHNLIPLESKTATSKLSSAPVTKSNPKTGDSIYLTGFVFLGGLLGGFIILNRRYQWIK